MKKKYIAHLCEIIGLLLVSFGALYVAFSIYWCVGVIIMGMEIGIIGSILENEYKKTEEETMSILNAKMYLNAIIKNNEDNPDMKNVIGQIKKALKELEE